MFEARTDLAIEARELYFEGSELEAEAEGVEAEAESCGEGICVTRVRILDKNGEKSLGKRVGNYITIEIPDALHRGDTAYDEACRVCAKELCTLVEDKGKGTVLVVGLGNWDITADALGPKAVKSVVVTRHLPEHMTEQADNRLRSVCAVSPGVLGITGVETGEIVRGIVDRVKPSLVIAIDALCSRRMERLNRTIQLTDTGITPGAGVGNRRMTIDESELGVPVIAIGVPTVVDAATIVSDTIDMLLEALKNNAAEKERLRKILSAVADEDKYGLIKQVLTPSFGDFAVTSKEIDLTISSLSDVIANGINIALHDGITLENIR